MLGNVRPCVGHTFKHNFPKKPSATDYSALPNCSCYRRLAECAPRLRYQGVLHSDLQAPIRFGTHSVIIRDESNVT